MMLILKIFKYKNFYQNKPVINLNQESQNDNLNLKIINNNDLTHDNFVNNISNNANINNNNLCFVSLYNLYLFHFKRKIIIQSQNEIIKIIQLLIKVLEINLN